MASFKKRQLVSGTGWRISYSRGGRKEYAYLPAGTPRSSVQQITGEIEKRVLAERLHGIPFTSPLKEKSTAGSGILLSAFIDKYLDFSRATKSENTFLLDRHALRKFAAAAGDVPLASIDYQAAQDHAVRRLKSVKPTSVNIEVRQLKAAFNQAVKWKHVIENPFGSVKPIRIKNQDFPAYLSKDEVRRLLDVIDDPAFRRLVQFYLFTGCRRDEALNLTWQDIDLHRGAVTFRKTKSGASRLVPLPDGLRDVLRGMDSTGRPFPFLRWTVTHRFKRYAVAAGLDSAFHLHSLRHTFASHLVMSGVDLLTVSRLLGHSSTRVTEIYAHLAPGHLRDATARLEY